MRMSLTLVLVRHGKAAAKRLGQTDFDRELTPAGREALAQAYGKTFAQLSDAHDIELWVSPAVRAEQTAAEIVAVLDTELAEERRLDCLYEQDADAFLDELSTRVLEGPGVVVAVGHVPFMEQLAAWLGGYELPFSTGAAAAFELKEPPSHAPAGRPPARLLWFVQGPRSS
jgi:phosphohistidine phosphatase